MRSPLLLFVAVLFAGVLLFMHGYYEHRLRLLRRNTQVEYRFVPRTMYEDQFFGEKASDIFRSMFVEDSAALWSKRDQLVASSSTATDTPEAAAATVTSVPRPSAA
jgi:hypothetical protein